MKTSRKTIRLKGYDYSQLGWYFVTVCTQNRECLFGNIVNHPVGVGRDRPISMVLNEFGKIVDEKINELKKYENVNVDIYCVMPNHVHMIIHIVGAGPCACPIHNPRVRPPCACPNISTNGSTQGSMVNGSTQGSTPTTLGEYIKRLKTLTTRIYIENVNNNGWKPFIQRLWQRNYYEQIVKNEIDLNKIREYVQSNPLMWERDRNNI